MDVTIQQLQDIEKYADRLFSAFNIDINFQNLYRGTHFFDRINDPRNISPITVEELQGLFKKASKAYGNYLIKFYKNYNKGEDVEAVFRDMDSDINLPFILVWDSENGELDLRPKTIIRKKDFHTSDKIFSLEMSMRTILRTIIKELNNK